ncbi:thiaminase II [Candidatus Nitronereus thalassa]|uniref:Aminopyrimidine aminohydrolase n=1 Tax=Candidatus Nitronereus thalassa TaxID=3020898 RepID=A0ABU3K3Y4_9BACT|nr:thiaminase II [Candidatus Nitronereus thalassa]MDT7041079.1 thiaminase II [Candidatus Nitronereus thalassa]
MSFTEQMRTLAKPIWDAQLKHPFVKALGKGTLPLKKFQYYILQDARYLEELARVFALGAQRANDPDTALRFAQLVEETIVVERGLHETYGKQWKLTAKAMRSTPMSPTNYAYCRHMRSVAQTGTLAELTVVALPCAWVYCVVGQHLLGDGLPPDNHPYGDWLKLYGSPEFAEVTQFMRTLVDREAKVAGKAEKDRMMRDFLTSSRYEWMFWDMAWREEQWPV